MASIAAIRTALKTRLESIDGLQVYRSWAGNFNFPCAVIDRVHSEPEQALGRGELTRWGLEVYLLASLAPGYSAAIERLDPYLATSSTGGVFGAIAADRTLGGVVHSTFVQGYREDEQIDLGSQLSAVGIVIELEAWSS